MLRRRTLLKATTVGLLAGSFACSPPDDEPSGETQPMQHVYGDDPAQVCDLYLPRDAPTATVILVHGGYWQAGYDRSLEAAVAKDLLAAGYAVWNIDYRGVGAGGGYPATFEDVAAAVDLLADVGPKSSLDLARVAVVGHSAGGQLALWAVGRAGLPAGATGAGPALVPAAAVTQAGVNNLVAAHRESLGGGAVGSLLGLGAAEEVAAELASLTSPAQMLPLGVPQLVVTGSGDDVVPPSQSGSYAAEAKAAGDDVVLSVVEGEGHFAHLDPQSRSWAVARQWLVDVVG